MGLPEQVSRAVARALDDKPGLVAAAAGHVRGQVPALQGLPHAAVEAFVDLLLTDALHAVVDGEDPSDDVLRELEPFVVQRAELGVAVDDILRGLHLGSGVIIDALLDLVDPELTGRQAADLMRRVDTWLDLIRRRVLLVHRRTEIELAQAGRDRSSALLASLLDPQQAPDLDQLAALGLRPDQPLHLTRTRPATAGTAWAAERAWRAQLDGAALSGVVDGDVVGISAAATTRAVEGLRLAVAGPVPLEDLAETHLLLGLALDLDPAPGLVLLHTVADRVAQARNPLLAQLLSQALLAQLDPQRREHHDLLTTVAAFCDNAGRLDRTASELHVHVNTVKHRLGRFHALTDGALDDVATRPSLRWAVQVSLAGVDGDAPVSRADGPGRPPR